MTHKEICALFELTKIIAVVGLSPKPERPSYYVSRDMQADGYRIIPVRPGIKELLGELVYADLSRVPDKVDIVNVFRASKYVPEIVEQSIQIGVKCIWLQEGIVHEEAAQVAREAGLKVVMDQCIRKAYLNCCG